MNYTGEGMEYLRELMQHMVEVECFCPDCKKKHTMHMEEADPGVVQIVRCQDCMIKRARC